MLLTACGGDEEPVEEEPVEEEPLEEEAVEEEPVEEEPVEEEPAAEGETEAAGDGGFTEDTDLSVDTVEMAINGEIIGNLWSSIATEEMFFPQVGFEAANIIYTGETVAALVGESVWVIQDESQVTWPAIAAGAGNIVMVGVEKDAQPWILAVDEDIQSAEDLPGVRISGGPPGDPWTTVAENVLTDEFGIDPSEMEWVSTPGSDARLEAMLAGELDAAILQPRHQTQLEEAGGQFLFFEWQDIAQEQWLVRQDFLDENRDAVCAFMDAQVQARQYLTAGEDGTENRDEVVALAEERGVERVETDVADWPTWSNYNWTTDAGATAESLDAMQAFLTDQGGIIPEDFDWRDHVDFSCLWEAQERHGLPLNPDPAAVEQG